MTGAQEMTFACNQATYQKLKAAIHPAFLDDITFHLTSWLPDGWFLEIGLNGLPEGGAENIETVAVALLLRGSFLGLATK